MITSYWEMVHPSIPKLYARLLSQFTTMKCNCALVFNQTFIGGVEDDAW